MEGGGSDQKKKQTKLGDFVMKKEPKPKAKRDESDDEFDPKGES